MHILLLTLLSISTVKMSSTLCADTEKMEMKFTELVSLNVLLYYMILTSVWFCTYKKV